MNLSHTKHFRRAIAVTTLLFSLVAFAFPITANAQTAPTGITVQGELKDTSGNAHGNLNLDFRVSFWGDADYDASTDNSSGSLVGSGHTAAILSDVSTDANGFFYINLTDLPASFDAASHRFLQVEARLGTSTALTDFKVLDYIASNPLVERKDAAMMGAFAQTADYAVTAGDAATVGGLDLATYYREPAADAAALAAISDMVAGTVVFQTDTAEVKFYDGTQWNTLGEDNAATLTALQVRVTANEADIISNAAAAAAATTAAAQAQTAADAAQADADTAQAAANAAQADATANATDITTAQAAADAAQATANSATTAAAAAQTTANAAQTAAATNTTNIATNVTNITTNTAAIASNDTDITTNTTAAAAAQTTADAAQVDATANGTAITAIQSDVTQAQGDIVALQNAIDGLTWLAPVAAFGDISTTYSSPTSGDVVATTASGEAYMYDGSAWNLLISDFAVSNASTTIAGIVELATDGETTAGLAVQANDSRLAQVATNTTDIATNASALTTSNTNITTNATNIATNATDIAGNTTNVATNATNISTNTTAIDTMQQSITFDQYAMDF